MDSAILNEYGICYEKGLARCMNDKDLYEKILVIFLEDDIFDKAEKYFAVKDYEGLFQCMHELKGASGNVDIKVLYEEASAFVEILRNVSESDEVIAEHYRVTKELYDRAKVGIRLASKQ